MKCRADPACAFPAVDGGRVCRRHLAEEDLILTLHEVSCCGRVRVLDEQGDVWRGFRITPNDHGVAWDRRLRVGNATEQRKVGRPKMTEEERKRRYSNTYCSAKLDNGVTCNTPIPVEERICESCRARLLPEKK